MSLALSVLLSFFPASLYYILPFYLIIIMFHLAQLGKLKAVILLYNIHVTIYVACNIANFAEVDYLRIFES